MTRRRANKKEARSGILVIFAAPGACVTRVPVPEISRPPSFPSADVATSLRGGFTTQGMLMIPLFFFSNVPQIVLA